MTTLVRSGSALAAAGLLIGMLSGCTPTTTPAPKPTKTAAFATDEEAFKAAEETYRAFIDESNREEGDEEKYLGGLAVDDHLDAEQQLKHAGLRGVGEAIVTTFEVDNSTLSSDRSSLTATACLDITDVRVINIDNQDVTPDNRSDVVATRVEMELSGNRFLIFKELDEDNEQCSD